MYENARSGAEGSSGCRRKSSWTCMQGHQRSSEVIRGHQRSSEVIRGQARSCEVFRHLAVSQRSSEVIRGHQRSSKVIRSLQAPGRFAARQRARALSWRRRNRRGAGSRRTCTPIMYHHVSSHAIMCPRQSAAGICLESAYRLGKRCGEHLHARRGFINGNQRTGWESVGYVARGRRSCTRPSLGR